MSPKPFPGAHDHDGYPEPLPGAHGRLQVHAYGGPEPLPGALTHSKRTLTTPYRGDVAASNMFAPMSSSREPRRGMKRISINKTHRLWRRSGHV